MLLLLVPAAAFSLAGCWIAHRAHDRPELRREIGQALRLTHATVLFRDPGGRLHLTDSAARDVLHQHTVIARLPAHTPLIIKDVIYRVSEPGRTDFYVTEISQGKERWVVEVPTDEAHRPRWQ